MSRFKPILKRTGAFVTALLVVGCKETAAPEGQTLPKSQIVYDYKLELPSKFKRQQVQGVDSKVEEWRSADTIISTDFGHYSSPPTCYPKSMSCSISKEPVGGRPSSVARYRHTPEERSSEPKPFRIFVHVPVNESQRLRLNLFARCDSEAACNEALVYFRRVRLSEEVRSGGQWDSGQVPPPPPPPSPAPR